MYDLTSLILYLLGMAILFAVVLFVALALETRKSKKVGEVKTHATSGYIQLPMPAETISHPTFTITKSPHEVDLTHIVTETQIENLSERVDEVEAAFRNMLMDVDSLTVDLMELQEKDTQFSNRVADELFYHEVKNEIPETETSVEAVLVQPKKKSTKKKVSKNKSK